MHDCKGCGMCTFETRPELCKCSLATQPGAYVKTLLKVWWQQQKGEQGNVHAYLSGSLKVGILQCVLVYSLLYSSRALRLRSMALRGTCIISC